MKTLNYLFLTFLGLIILNNGFRSMGGVAKKELRYILPLALFCWKIGIIFIDRNNPKEAMKIMAEAFSLNKVLGEGTICRYPLID